MLRVPNVESKKRAKCLLLGMLVALDQCCVSFYAVLELAHTAFFALFYWILLYLETLNRILICLFIDTNRPYTDCADDDSCAAGFPSLF